jgi:hypothetical protein
LRLQLEAHSMKRKLADYVVSKARHLFDREVKFYDNAGVLIRQRAMAAARTVARLGRNTDVEFHKALKEFLAFFCVLAVNEIAIKPGPQGNRELPSIYKAVLTAVCEGAEPDPARRADQLTINRLITYKKSGFDHWFYGYWNADFGGMRVSTRLLEELAQCEIAVPSGDTSRDAMLILLVRLGQQDRRRAGLPPAHMLKQYQTAIQQEITRFLCAFKELTS